MKLFSGFITIIIGWIIKLFAKMSWAKIIEAILVQIAWKKLLYIIATSVVLPLLKKYVDDTESKFDNKMYDGLCLIVETFLGPKQHLLADK